MPFMQATFVNTVQLVIGCVHTLFNLFNDTSHERECFMCACKFKVTTKEMNKPQLPICLTLFSNISS